MGLGMPISEGNLDYGTWFFIHGSQSLDRWRCGAISWSARPLLHNEDNSEVSTRRCHIVGHDTKGSQEDARGMLEYQSVIETYYSEMRRNCRVSTT